MPTTEHRDRDESAALSPEESLALIEATMRDTRTALGFSEWPFYLVWGIAWAIAFTSTHLVLGGDDPLLGHLPDYTVGIVWMVCILGAVLVTTVVIARGSRGVTGTSERIGKRIGLSWAASFTAAGILGGLLGLQDHEFGALFVLVVALLYLGQGAAFLDDLMIGMGIWLLAVDVGAVALGPDWYSLVLAILGAGSFLVAAAISHGKEQKAGLSDG